MTADVSCTLCWALAVGACGILANFMCKYFRAPSFDVSNKHVFISGGSTGLGLATAKEYAKKGANLTLIARSSGNLTRAEKYIKRLYPDVTIHSFSCDVTDFKVVQKTVANAIVAHGQPIHHVICCAGLAVPGFFLEQSTSIFQQEMDVNYFGSLYVVKAILPNMISSEDKSGQRVVFVSSACGYIGFAGYSQYCASKYALRGLADCLRNELKLYGISVSVFYPGNMDTPGYEMEEKNKPQITRDIEGASAVVTPEAAAQSLLKGLQQGDFAITNDIGGWLLRVVGNGMAPRQNAVLEMLLMPLVVLIQTIYVVFMDREVVKAKKTHNVAELLLKKQK